MAILARLAFGVANALNDAPAEDENIITEDIAYAALSSVWLPKLIGSRLSRRGWPRPFQGLTLAFLHAGHPRRGSCTASSTLITIELAAITNITLSVPARSSQRLLGGARRTPVPP